MKTVTFCGHSILTRDEATKLRKILPAVIESLINDGADTFLLGGYGEFDLLCAQSVKELKKNHSYIKSILVIPYIGKDFNRKLYDFSEYPPIENVPKRFAILKRNQYMIDCSDAVIAYISHSFGGAYNSYKYARRKNKHVVSLFSA